MLGWFVWSCPRTAEAWKWGRWRLRLDLRYSAGWDDNVSRLALPPEPDTLVRWKRLAPVKINKENPIKSQLPSASIQQDGVHQLSSLVRVRYRSYRHIWSARYTLGGKIFFLTPGEDVLIQGGQTSYYGRPHRRILLGASFNGKDRRRVNTSREFTFLNGQLHFLWFAPLGFRLSINAGYNYFNYRNFEGLKPDSFVEDYTDGQRFSFHGDAYDVTLTKQFGRSFRMYVGYQLTRRNYGIKRERQARPTESRTGNPKPLDSHCSLDPTDINRFMVCSQEKMRTDLSHRITIGFRLLYKVLLKGAYHLRILNAPSYGESFLGHNIQLTFATTPFWKLYLVIQLQLQFRNYFNGIPFDTSRGQTSAADNLTSLTIRLSRPIWKSLHANLHFSHNANLFGLGINQYSRNLLTVGFFFFF